MIPNNRLPTAVVAALVAAVMLSTAVGGAAAQQDSLDPFSAFGDGDEAASILTDTSEALDVLQAIGATAVDRLQYSLESTVGETPDAEQTATDVSEFANSNSGAIVNYANNHVNESVNKSQINVIKVEFIDDEDNTATRYAVLNVNQTTGNFSSLSVNSSTDRSVDYQLTVGEYGSARALETIQTVYDDYVQAEKAPDTALRARLTSKYGSQIEVSQP